MGRDNFVGHGAVLGKSPQHRGYRGEPTLLRIGDGNVFREHVTIHRGTVQGGGETRIGDRNMFMIGTHLGHDVPGRQRLHAGQRRAAWPATASLHDGCILSGHSAVQQRVRIGRLAMLGGLGSTTKDIPPFVLQQGYNCVTGPEPRRPPPRGVRGRGDRRLCGTRSASSTRKAGPRPAPSSGSRPTSGQIPEVAEFVAFIRASQIGINTAREGARAMRAS